MLKYLKGGNSKARLVGEDMGASSTGAEQSTTDVVQRKREMTPQPSSQEVKHDFQALREEQGSSGLVGINELS